MPANGLSLALAAGARDTLAMIRLAVAALLAAAVGASRSALQPLARSTAHTRPRACIRAADGDAAGDGGWWSRLTKAVDEEMWEVRALGVPLGVFACARPRAEARGARPLAHSSAGARAPWLHPRRRPNARRPHQFIYGKRDKQWNPDRRSEEERGKPFDFDSSTLSWGGLKGSATTFDSYASTALPEDSAAELPGVGSGGSMLAGVDAAAGDAPLTGRELAELTFNKYQRYHDIGLQTFSPFGQANRQVAVNIYGPALGFGSFKLTEQMYIEKLDFIASAVNEWGQAGYVRAFLLSPLVPRRGLPSRPRADTAVTLRLNESPTWAQVPQEDIDAYWQFL